MKELAAHYELACKGDLHRALLMGLDAGFDFTKIVGAMGDRGVGVAFTCVVKGWIDRGQITAEGRSHLASAADA